VVVGGGFLVGSKPMKRSFRALRLERAMERAGCLYSPRIREELFSETCGIDGSNLAQTYSGR
jgi:hypothetical protein